MTTTTTTKQASSSAALPPRDLQDDSRSSGSKLQVEVAVETDMSATDIRETIEHDIDNPVVSPDHGPASNLDPDSDHETQMTEEEDDDDEDEKLKAPKSTTDILMAHVLEQNRYLIEQLAGQNKAMVDHLATPPVSFCAGECLSSSESKKKKKKSVEKTSSSSVVTNADVVVRRILRIASVIMLVVIAMQLGSMRGDVAAGKNGRKVGGFFGR